MANTSDSASTDKVVLVRDARSGQFVEVRGVGALKGRLRLKKGVDLTKPIAAQVMGGRKSR
jgi:hypothetical protein